jgi:hypothetical protein
VLQLAEPVLQHLATRTSPSPAARALIYTNSDFTITSLERLRELIAKHMEADGRMKKALQNPVGVFPSHKQNMTKAYMNI